MWRCVAGTVVVGFVAFGMSDAQAAGRPAGTTPSGPVAYIVVDADSGTVLAEREADKQWPPASMAKMMTVLVALERVRAGRFSLDEPVRVSEKASRTGGSQVFLAAGETFTLGQLLEAVMIPSANDASVAVAEHVAGSTTAFVDLMNERARQLGMSGTRYQSVHGLPPEPGQTPDLTTARDLATLGRKLLEHPDAAKWAATAESTFRNGSFVMRNTNHLVRTYAGATGLKTGYYAAAGFSVTATARRGDLQVMAVVLGEPSKKGCFDEAARLMSDAFGTWKTVVAARRGVPIGKIPVSGGAERHVRAMPTQDLRLLVKRAEDRGVAVEARIPRLVQAPVQQRQQLGEVVIRRGDQELGRVPVVADGEVASTGWLAWLWNRSLTGATLRP